MIHTMFVRAIGYGQRECPQCMARMGHENWCPLKRR